MFKTSNPLYFLLAIACLLLTGCATWQPEKNQLLKQTTTSSELSVAYFGTSTLLFRDNDASILIDGYFSRLGISEAFINGMKSNEKAYAQIEKLRSHHNLKAVVVAHSHFDHLLDAPVVAKETNATFVGSQQSIDIAKNYYQLTDDKTQLIIPKETLSYDNFLIDFYQTEHGHKGHLAKLFEKIWLTFSRGSHFIPDGGNYSLLITHKRDDSDFKMLIVPSANYYPNGFPNVKADIVFLGIGLLDGSNNDEKRSFIEKYWHEAVVNTGAKLVIPIHWDDLYKPLGRRLKSAPKFVDDTEGTVEYLQRLANSPKYRAIIKLMPHSTKINIEQAFEDAKQALTEQPSLK